MSIATDDGQFYNTEREYYVSHFKSAEPVITGENVTDKRPPGATEEPYNELKVARGTAEDQQWLEAKIKASGAREEATGAVKHMRESKLSPMEMAVGLVGGPRLGELGLGVYKNELSRLGIRNVAEKLPNPFTQTAFHGTYETWEASFRRLAASHNVPFYSTNSPELASLYAGSHPKVAQGYVPKHSSEFGPYGLSGGSVVPLKLDVSEYHVVDAGGGTWDASGGSKMRAGLLKAQEEGKKGLIVRNIFDEPSGGSRELGTPKDVYLTFDPKTVRSFFAKFDPANFHLNDLLASGAITGIMIKGASETESKK
jgi:hypothetical protein